MHILKILQIQIRLRNRGFVHLVPDQCSHHSQHHVPPLTGLLDSSLTLPLCTRPRLRVDATWLDGSQTALLEAGLQSVAEARPPQPGASAFTCLCICNKFTVMIACPIFQTSCRYTPLYNAPLSLKNGSFFNHR